MVASFSPVCLCASHSAAHLCHAVQKLLLSAPRKERKELKRLAQLKDEEIAAAHVKFRGRLRRGSDIMGPSF